MAIRRDPGHVEPGPAREPTRAELVAGLLRALEESLALVEGNLERLSWTDVLPRRTHEAVLMLGQVRLLKAAARGLGVKP